MTERERLIELIREAMEKHEITVENYVIPTSDYIADYLLENGVIVSPFELDDTRKMKKMDEYNCGDCARFCPIDERNGECSKLGYVNCISKICKDFILNDMRLAIIEKDHPAEKSETGRQIQTAKTMIEKMVSCYDRTEKGSKE